MDPHDAGRTARSLETLHALGYFAPEVEAELTGLGLRKGRMGYFASRSAPMGRVGPGTVAATFYVFNPDARRALPPRRLGRRRPRRRGGGALPRRLGGLASAAR